MKNIHIIYSNWDYNKVRILENFGIKVEQKYDKIEMEENETYWKLKPYLDKWEINDHVISKFSDEDLNSATLLVFNGVWTNGYPMPDNDFGYMKTTYDDKEYCKNCGMGLVQKEPFRLKKEPNWGNKNVFMLGWIFDEIFVKKDFYETVLKRYGIEVLPVLLYKKEIVIDNTVQLRIPVTASSLQLEDYNYTICNSCNRKRYDLINKGFFPTFHEDTLGQHLFKSREFFGTGANARKHIFMSSELRKVFDENKVKANYIPVATK